MLHKCLYFTFTCVEQAVETNNLFKMTFRKFTNFNYFLCIFFSYFKAILIYKTEKSMIESKLEIKNTLCFFKDPKKLTNIVQIFGECVYKH